MKRLWNSILAGAGSMLIGASAHATMLQKMDINDLVDRSDAVFRGTVIDVEQGTVSAGGGELPAITYRLKVDDMLKGSADVVKGDERYMEIQMVGSIKAEDNQGDMVRFSMFRDVPRLNMGSDYVLFMTPESSIGLSVTVGLGQGAFTVQSVDKEDMVVNAYGNLGLGLGEPGPATYESLRAAIAAASGN